jgi:hypothetical protein
MNPIAGLAATIATLLGRLCSADYRRLRSALASPRAGRPADA